MCDYPTPGAKHKQYAKYHESGTFCYMSTETEHGLQQINYRVDPKVRRWGQLIASANGESLPAMSRRLLEDWVKSEAGIDPSLVGVELDIALLDVEIGIVQGELAGLEAEKADLLGTS
jgi:hypothetical protein